MDIFNRLVWTLLVLLLFGKISLSTVQAFDSYVIHPALARVVALEYNNQNPDNLLSTDEIKWFTQGALEEDEPSIRVLNHFFNPLKNEGLRVGGVVLGLSAPEWAYAKNQQQIELGGDCSWPTAVAAYQGGDKAKAFRCLGHVLHVMEDMGVPAHTRNDQHLIGDPFEQWAKYHNPVPGNEAVREPNCTTAKDCIISFGTWVNKNFLSKNTINNLDFELPFNKATIEGEYLTANQIKLAVYNPKNKDFSLTAEIQAGYWQKISPMIKAYGKKLITVFLLEAKHQPPPPLPSQIPPETSVSSDHRPPYIPSLTTVLNPSSSFKLLTESINSSDLIPTIIPISPKKETIPEIPEKVIEPVPNTYIIKRPASTIKETTAQFVFSSDIPSARFECSYNIFSWFDCGSSYYITGLESGRHSLFVRAVSDTGYDLTPQYYSWLVDISTPKTFLFSFTSKTSRQASFRFISELGAKFDCQLDSEAWKECLSPFKSDELRSGNHTFSVRAHDTVGNIEEEPVSYQWTIEMARPVSPIIIFPEKSPYYTRLPEIVVLGSVEPTLNVITSTLTEQNEVERVLDNWSYRTSLNIGENIFSYRSLNHHGEESLPVSARIIYDVDSPEIKYFDLPEMNSGRDFFVSWEGNDNSNGLLTYDVMYRETEGEWQSWLEDTALTEAQFINEFPSENISFRIRAIDQAGNASDWLEKNIISIQIEETDHLVISQVIPKGRNGSTDEFIEIYNPTSFSISLQGFSFQKKSKAEIIWHAVVPAAQHEFAVVNPRGYYLLSGASYSYLTAPDITVMNELLHDDNGHIRIVNNLGIVVDRLGYGQANNPEINAAPQPSLGVSLHRKAQSSSTALSLRQFPNLGNGYDSNNNFDDFVLQTEVLPKNSQTVF